MSAVFFLHVPDVPSTLYLSLCLNSLCHVLLLFLSHLRQMHNTYYKSFFPTLLVYVCTVCMQMFVCVCLFVSCLTLITPPSPRSCCYILRCFSVWTGASGLLWAHWHHRPVCTPQCQSVGAAGELLEGAVRQTDRHQQRHLAHEGSPSINKFQSHASFKLLRLGDLCVLT